MCETKRFYVKIKRQTSTSNSTKTRNDRSRNSFLLFLAQKTNFKMESDEKSFSNVCRLCLRYDESNKTRSLVNSNRENGLSVYGESYKSLTSLNINLDDNLPRNICSGCKKELKRIEHFKSMCKMNYERLNLLVNYYYKSSSAKAKMEAAIQYSMYSQYFPDKYQESYLKNVKGIPLKRVKEKVHKNDVKLKKIRSETTKSYKKDIVLPKLEVEIDYNDTNNFSDHENQDAPMEGLSQPKTENVDSFLGQMENIFIENCSKPKKKRIKLNDYQTGLSEDKSKPKTEEINSFLSEMENIFTEIHPKPTHRDYHTLGDSKSCVTPSEDKSQPKTQDIDSLLDQMENIFTKPRLKQKKRLIPKSQPQNFSCNVCNKKLANKNTYRDHMQSHEQYLFICDQCGKGFATKASMNIHLVARHGVPSSYECDSCSFKAPRRIELIEHIRLHTGERPFTCEKCGLNFRRRAIYTSHLKCHDEKKIQCPMCPKKFYRAGEMKSHMNSIHERMYLYLCRICNTLYAKTTTVRKHMVSKHGIARENQGKILRVTKNSHRGLFKESKDREF